MLLALVPLMLLALVPLMLLALVPLMLLALVPLALVPLALPLALHALVPLAPIAAPISFAPVTCTPIIFARVTVGARHDGRSNASVAVACRAASRSMGCAAEGSPLI
jgi:hypothetical protein